MIKHTAIVALVVSAASCSFDLELASVESAVGPQKKIDIGDITIDFKKQIGKRIDCGTAPAGSPELRICGASMVPNPTPPPPELLPDYVTVMEVEVCERVADDASGPKYNCQTMLYFYAEVTPLRGVKIHSGNLAPKDDKENQAGRQRPISRIIGAPNQPGKGKNIVLKPKTKEHDHAKKALDAVVAQNQITEQTFFAHCQPGYVWPDEPTDTTAEGTARGIETAEAQAATLEETIEEEIEGYPVELISDDGSMSCQFYMDPAALLL